MNDYRYTLEPFLKHDLDKNRFRVKLCPCGKHGNNDGKFVPFEKFEDRGHCYSCATWFPVANHICPGCSKEKAFNKYIDSENSDSYLDDFVGKCMFCEYHYPPKQFFEDYKNLTETEKQEKKERQTQLLLQKISSVKDEPGILAIPKEPISFNDPIIKVMFQNLGYVTLGCTDALSDICNPEKIIIDGFSGRVHSPITRLSKIMRSKILLQGQKTISLDVATMQPMLLGKILQEKIGDNEFSQWIDSGKDVYLMLQQKANLLTRDEGKQLFFNFLFSKPTSKGIYENTGWVTWINQYKSTVVPDNPNTIEKPHSNLSWLLQKKEVETMKKVWKLLVARRILFLSIHDSVIVKENDKESAVF